MDTKKKVRDFTKEERLAYNRERYEARMKGALTFTIINCPDDLREAILNAIKESK